MQQISSKLNMYMARIVLINNNIERLILNIIFWSFGALALLYIIFLGNMVKNIIERQGLEMSARALSSEVRSLEVAYLSLSSGVDLELSHSLGFKETQPTFATRKTLGLGGSVPFGNVKITKNDL